MTEMNERNAVYSAPPDVSTKPRAISGFAAGLIASGCWGTGAVTLGLFGAGAGSLAGIIGKYLNAQFLALSGFLLAVIIVLGVTYLTVRRFRPRMSPEAFKQLYMNSLIRTAGWAVGSYLVWFILISPILSHLGVKIF